MKVRFYMLLPLAALSLFVQSFFQSALAAEVMLNKVHFSAEATGYFDNDVMTVKFTAQAEHTNPQVVATQINQKMQKAYRILKPFALIQVKTGQYQINPVYKKQTLIGWKGQQTLILTMQNRPGLAKILVQIQPYLNYQNIQFSISEQRKQAFIADLTRQAILNYREKAEFIAKNFQSPRYHLLNTNISNREFHPRPGLYREMSIMVSRAKQAQPLLKSGQSKLTVTISGTMALE